MWILIVSEMLVFGAARPSAANVETGTRFWRMADLVRVLIFPVVYLLR